MRTIIALKDLEGLPSTEELQSYMYYPGLSFSYAKTNIDLKRSDFYSISWDRRSDCLEWFNVKDIGHKYTFIDFEIYREGDKIIKSIENSDFIDNSIKRQYLNFIAVEIGSEAYFIDYRAYVRAIYYISKTIESLICEENYSEVLDCNGYYDKYDKVIDREFEIKP